MADGSGGGEFGHFVSEVVEERILQGLLGVVRILNFILDVLGSH